MGKQSFHYVSYEGILMPYVPIRLINKNLFVDTNGLVDSGASVNVLPYQVGLDLGCIWNDSAANFTLAGNLAHYPACPVLLDGIIGRFPLISLGFAWVKTDNVSLLLGGINFFNEFDVCFYRKRQIFEISSTYN